MKKYLYAIFFAFTLSLPMQAEAIVGGYSSGNSPYQPTSKCSGTTPVESVQADGSIVCSCNNTSCGPGGACVRHPKYSSLTLQYNYSICQCRSGYYMNGSSCSACPAGCSSCSSSSTCTACSSGYSLEGGKCVEKIASISGSCPSGMTKSDDGCCCLNN